ncbi:MAG: helix-turn-helix transcriptional regulator, partial [Erysipelotrichaceae bacterium]|nr:helix-turn-helix transcriptional regulator [Erysipelotrichaceae bacterium]
MDPQKTGDYIKQKRMAKAITQEEIAYRLGVSKNTVSRWERGINLPDYKVLSKLAEQLDTEADEILRGEDSFSSADRNYESSEAD